MDKNELLDTGIALMGEFDDESKKIVEPHIAGIEAHVASVVNVGKWLGVEPMLDALRAALFSAFAHGYKQAQADTLPVDSVWGA